MELNEGLKNKKYIKKHSGGKKPPPYQWQETALRVIEQLAVPNSKRNAVFRVCKLKHSNFIEQCLAETKELCREGEAWKYFFKLTSKKNINQKNIN